MTLNPFGKNAFGKNLVRILLLACALTAFEKPVLAASILELNDNNQNGLLDADEARDAAEDQFDDLDKDDDDVLDRAELGFRLSDAAFARADLNRDGTLSEFEFLALVKERFEKADTDHDNSLSEAELRTKAGRAFLILLQ